MTEFEHLLPYYKKPTLILGCGNILFGDDGFGPRVIEHLLLNHSLPDDVYALDVGLGARDVLFSISLGGTNVQRLIIVDAVDFREKGRKPGDVFEIDLDDLPEVKRDDFSMHQVPSSNLLRELRDYCNLNIKLFVCQIKQIPDEVEPGLSDAVAKSVDKMCDLLISNI
jgi:coenzyme F420 hydrogenase subunit delta